MSNFISFRFTDFLVHEVDLDSQVVHIKSLAMPESGKKDKTLETADQLLPSVSEPIAAVDEGRSNEEQSGATSTNVGDTVMDNSLSATERNIQNHSGTGEVKEEEPASHEPWPERFNTVLKPFLSDDIINRIKKMFLEGPEPPRVSDRGWEQRTDRSTDDIEMKDVADAQAAQGELQLPSGNEKTAKRDRDSGRRGRGGRGQKRAGGGIEDERKVLSDVSL
jgi:tRNA pseudouridine13 synthase